MQMQVVSRQIFIGCLVISLLVLIVFILSGYTYKTAVYVCNNQDELEVYIRHDREDIVFKPQKVKNTLTCLGKGMPFYDRTIEWMIGNLNEDMYSELSTRYKLSRGGFIETDESQYPCLHLDQTILVIQDKIEMDILLNTLSHCSPEMILLTEKYKNVEAIKASLSPNIKLHTIEKDTYKKIVL